MVLMTVGTIGICIFGVVYITGYAVEAVKTLLPKKKTEKPEIENEPEAETEIETETNIETETE